MAGIPRSFLLKKTPLIYLIKHLRIKGEESNCSSMGLGQGLFFLSRLEIFLITTCCVNATLKVVYGLLEALYSGSGFTDLRPIPLSMQHVAIVGERIPPSSGGYSLGFFSI